MEQNQKSPLGKIIGAFLVLVILTGLAYGFYWYFSKPRCNIPVKFTIDSVDPKFNLTKDNVLVQAENAGKLWNDQTAKNLFISDPSARLKINMIYDSRQGEIDKIHGQATTLQTQKSTLESQNQQFEALLQTYKSQLDQYNSEVEFYNKNGGAPQDKFDSLNAKLKDLKDMQSQLKDMASTLNRQSDLYNTGVDTLNQDINQSANKIITQGEFDPNSDTINIYTFGNNNELRFVLAHELGHALGLDHVSDPNALMYAMVQKQDLANPKLTQADLDEVERVCNFNAKFEMPTLQDLRNLLFSKATQT